ncbi:MAG TPA: nuclear transport factor 2 family protein [Dehalococcoidia bacterium]|nr:nuclear transport factor 2 family protein [Dehalococcoidia bacterium]
MTPRETVTAFIGAINRRDLEALLRLMTDNHVLKVMDEPEVVGKQNLREAWRAYFDAFPAYVIHPQRFAQNPGGVAVLGHTPGSHLGLPDEEEAKQTLIWNAGVRGDKLSAWVLLPDTPRAREALGLSGPERRSGPPRRRQKRR